ncbi:hypothetical protein [Sediminibacillus albus]|uniref:Uncharacterized protein n=1 Tax=Sediminibacillus albus TaxID=407036 RepID=A0A1G9AM92_9BACI|nr:hypothetical protein [Sediminibacillus albus]SDK28361.1 hypothetical protein SAMN05216243_2605 [Sediminibacillus albus]
MLKRIQYLSCFIILFSTFSLSLASHHTIHPSKGFIEETTPVFIQITATPDNEKKLKDSINTSFLESTCISIGFAALACFLANFFQSIRQWYRHLVTVFYQSSYFRFVRFNLKPF